MNNLGYGVTKQYRPLVYGRNAVRSNNQIRYNQIQRPRQNFSWWGSWGPTMPSIYPAQIPQFNRRVSGGFGF